jgi:hypothetical protein
MDGVGGEEITKFSRINTLALGDPPSTLVGGLCIRLGGPLAAAFFNA